MKRTILTMVSVMLITICLGQSNNKGTIKKDTLDPKKELIKKMGLDTMVVDQLYSIIIEKDSIIKTTRQEIDQTKFELAKSRAKEDIFGGIPPIDFLIGELFLLLGIFVNTTIITKKSIKNNDQTPKEFSWKYWWQNNKDRILRWLGIMGLGFIGMRFSLELFGLEFSMFLCVLFGLFLDAFIEYVRNIKPPFDKNQPAT